MDVCGVDFFQWPHPFLALTSPGVLLWQSWSSYIQYYMCTLPAEISLVEDGQVRVVVLHVDDAETEGEDRAHGQQDHDDGDLLLKGLVPGRSQTQI